MTHIIVFLILAIAVYALGHSHGRKSVMGQVRDAAQSFKDLLK